MTEDELQAIEARANAATPGPWVEKSEASPSLSITKIVAGDKVIARPYYGWQNGEFIARAREDVPALIVEIRRLRASVVTWQSPSTR